MSEATWQPEIGAAYWVAWLGREPLYGVYSGPSAGRPELLLFLSADGMTGWTTRRTRVFRCREDAANYAGFAQEGRRARWRYVDH